MPPRIIGDTSGKTIQIRLVDGVGAGGQAAPATADDGFSLVDITREFRFEDRGLIMIHKAGNGTAIELASAMVYGYYAEREVGAGPSDWGPLGAASGAITAGSLNEAAVITQVGTRKILLLESVGGMRTIDRIAVATGAITAGAGDIVVHVDLILTRVGR
jgi:hypothetical protein